MMSLISLFRNVSVDESYGDQKGFGFEMKKSVGVFHGTHTPGIELLVSIFGFQAFASRFRTSTSTVFL